MQPRHFFVGLWINGSNNLSSCFVPQVATLIEVDLAEVKGFDLVEKDRILVNALHV